jgi:hypothetical protein
MTVVVPGIAATSTSTSTSTGLAEADGAAGRASEWEPRPCEESWWQTRQGREALVERLLRTFTDASAGRTRDKTRRRGLGKLLDWLERQPGDTWQDRWLGRSAAARARPGPASSS